MPSRHCSSYLENHRSSTQANAQFSAIEAYGGVGALSVPDEFFRNESTGQQFVGSGDGFFLQQEGTQTSFTSTEYDPGQNIQIGLEGHYAIGAHGSVYVGVRVNATFLRYREGNSSSEVAFFGPIDTVFFEPGTIGGGTPLVFCPGNSFGFGTNEPDQAVALDVGIPLGYRHRFFNDRIGLRVQGSVNVPVVSGHRTQTISLEEDVGMSCFRFEEVDANTSSTYRKNAFVFRLGGGVDFSLGHSFSLGVLVQQQLNSTIESSESFINDEGRFVAVPEIKNFKPLNISLVGRVLIR